MTDRLTQAIEEAYASAPVGVTVIDTLELAHPSLATPIRVATGIEDEIDLPLVSGGPLVTFTACAFSYVPPAIGEGGIEPARVSIDAVGRVLVDALDMLVPGGVAISVTYRAYTSADLTEPGEVWTGFSAKTIRSNGSTTVADIEFDDVSMINFPRQTYDQENFPGLFGGQAPT